MAKTRKVLALCILALAAIFIQQNLKWAYELYGVGPEANLYRQGIVQQAYNIGGIYLVKAKKVDQQLQFTYRLSTSKYFKIPLWPFATSIINYNCNTEQLSQIESLFKSDFAEVKFFQAQDVNFFIDAMTIGFSVHIILIWLLIGKLKIQQKT